MTDFAISKPATFAPEQSFACPDCGSKHWTLLNCAAPVARIEGEETK